MCTAFTANVTNTTNLNQICIGVKYKNLLVNIKIKNIADYIIRQRKTYNFLEKNNYVIHILLYIYTHRLKLLHIYLSVLHSFFTLITQCSAHVNF